MKPTYLLSSLVFLLITGVGLTGFYEKVPTQAIGVTIITGTALALLAYRCYPALNNQVQAISTENLILLHTIRAPIGGSFLILHAEGMMPEAFAMRAGWGDIAAAVLGVLIVLVASQLKNDRTRKGLYLFWSIFGLADLFVAVGTGLSLGIGDQSSMVWISRLPLLMVPTFVLPVLFSSHLIVLKRLWEDRKESASHGATV